MTTPLAERLRPRTLDEFIGQGHLVAEGKPLYQAVKTGDVPSMILWGPPGVGKTTLARLMARQTGRPFHALSAVSAGKADMQRIVQSAQPEKRPRTLFDDPDAAPVRGALLFLDEIHRFNKAQQDFLLPYVEDGTITLIGATTENPSFEVISALLSRVQVFVLNALADDEIGEIIRRGAAELKITLDDDGRHFLTRYADGDARAALNLMENAARLYAPDGGDIDAELLAEALQSKHVRYDRRGEAHYNTISAYIKSMRAGDTDAALYYLARMIDGGEDPKFIARRMVIFASEDVGLADPTALQIANAVFRAVEAVGLPEAQINLAHGTAYLARAPKDRSAYDAYFRALDDVREHGDLPIPLQLRNAPTQLMRDLGYGQAAEGEDSLLPVRLADKRYFTAPDSD